MANINEQVNALAVRIGQEFGNYVAKSEFNELLDNVGNKTYIVKDIAARNAITNVVIGSKAWVKDATADTTVEKGAAEYLWDGTVWHKLSEAESMDMVLNWDTLKDTLDPDDLLNDTNVASFIPSFEGALPGATPPSP